MIRRKTVLLAAIIVVVLFFFTINYLLKLLPASESEIRTNSLTQKAIYAELNRLPDIYRNARQIETHSIEVFLRSLDDNVNLALQDVDLEKLWDEANSWPLANQFTNISSPTVGKVMYALKHARITGADIDVRGTQLKLLLNLMGGQPSVFKPKWYNKDKIIEGPVYAGKDRYGSEIVAFYLSILLNKPLVPISVERTISLKYEILPVATRRLLNTTFERDNRTCVYGKCFYCKKDDPICEDEGSLLTGAVIFNVKKTFSNYRSPWQRTYKNDRRAQWEQDPEFCSIVKTRLNKKRIFDLIDTAIFDFLLQNGDRHHYETLDDTVVWVDNGKGLGNPFIQHIDILAPLYQCCMIRGKTWKALLNLAGGNLVKYLDMMPDIRNILTEQHLRAMEERLLLIFATVEYCKMRN